MNAQSISPGFVPKNAHSDCNPLGRKVGYGDMPFESEAVQTDVLGNSFRPAIRRRNPIPSEPSQTDRALPQGTTF